MQRAALIGAQTLPLSSEAGGEKNDFDCPLVAWCCFCFAVKSTFHTSKTQGFINNVLQRDHVHVCEADIPFMSGCAPGGPGVLEEAGVRKVRFSAI